MGAFEANTNPFGGIIPEPSGLPGDPVIFGDKLKESLEIWQAAGYKVVWLELNLDLADLVPVAVKQGFEYHHSGKNYLMLTKSIVENAFIPPYASHYIGAGGVAVNKNDELLVVHEKGRGSSAPFYKRSEEHTSELQSLVNLVCRLLLEKKKNKIKKYKIILEP